MEVRDVWHMLWAIVNLFSFYFLLHFQFSTATDLVRTVSAGPLSTLVADAGLPLYRRVDPLTEIV